MEITKAEDNISQRIKAMGHRIEQAQAQDLYYYNQPISELRGGARVLVQWARDDHVCIL